LPLGTNTPIIEAMPLVRLVTSASLGSDKQTDELLSKLSKLAASQFGKPERWVMTCLDATAKMTFAGTTEPACYVEVKNLGSLTPDLTERLSQELCQVLTQELAIHASRIYIEFTEVASGHLWGWDGSTFA
jgi:phenylpyruvate tautomerase PptA (4-oxalocrotonate tautomerase family)